MQHTIALSNSKKSTSVVYSNVRIKDEQIFATILTNGTFPQTTIKSDNFKVCLNEFLNHLSKLKENEELIFKNYHQELITAKINSFGKKIVVEVKETSPEYLLSYLYTCHGFLQRAGHYQEGEYNIDHSILKEVTIEQDHVTMKPKDTFVIAKLEFVDIHYQGFIVGKELLTTDENLAISKMMELSDKKIKYHLFKTTSILEEFKIDNYGNPVNELAVLIASNYRTTDINIDSEQTLTLFINDDERFSISRFVNH